MRDVDMKKWLLLFLFFLAGMFSAAAVVNSRAFSFASFNAEDLMDEERSELHPTWIVPVSGGVDEG